MVHYRRNRIRGGTFFFTVTLADRRSRLLVEHADLLREAFRVVRRKYPFQIEAIAVLPDHLHAIWKLPQDDDDYPGRWRAIKSRFTRMLRKRGAHWFVTPKENTGYGRDVIGSTQSVMTMIFKSTRTTYITTR